MTKIKQLIALFSALFILSSCANDVIIDHNRQGETETSEEAEEVIVLKHGNDVTPCWWLGDKPELTSENGWTGLTCFTVSSVDAMERLVPYEEIHNNLYQFRNGDPEVLEQDHFLFMRAKPIGETSSFYEWLGPYDRVIQSFTNMAMAARDSGMKGIFFDAEEYDGETWDASALCPWATVEECKHLAFFMGYYAADAMKKEWPEMLFVSTFGPWLHDPKTAVHFNETLPALNIEFPYTDWSNPNDTYPDFFKGMALVLDKNAVDGSEIYGLSACYDDAECFEAVKCWNKLQSEASIGFSAYNHPHAEGQPDMWQEIRDTMTPEIFAKSARTACQASDKVCWIYTEQRDWLGKGFPATPIEDEWRNALNFELSGL